MLFYYVDKASRVCEGLDRKTFDESRLYRSLSMAKDDKRGKIFVLDSRKIPATLSGKVRAVPVEALQNVDPYLSPEEAIAGGGIVTRPGKKGLEILLIFRKGVWDIAKGKLDPGETIKQCAKREVKEELGIDHVKVHGFLDTTTHGYAHKRKYIVKTTYWYHMTTKATEFVPQLEEKITDVQWFKLKKAKKVLGHKSLIRLLNRVEHKLL